MKTVISMVFSVLVLFAVQPVRAQSSSMGSFRQNFATVIFAGLGGAVLGLSTLSFYGEPQEHIGNIWTGLALGVLGGSAYVVQKATDRRLDQQVEAPTNPNKKRVPAPALFVYEFEF